MQSILLAFDAELLIPIISIIMSLSIPLFAIYYSYRKQQDIMREREVMIKEGMMPPPLKEDIQSPSRRDPLLLGINFTGVGLGMLLGWLFYRYNSEFVSAPIAMFAGALLCVGIANIIYGTRMNKIKSQSESQSPSENI